MTRLTFVNRSSLSLRSHGTRTLIVVQMWLTLVFVLFIVEWMVVPILMSGPCLISNHLSDELIRLSIRFPRLKQTLFIGNSIRWREKRSYLIESLRRRVSTIHTYPSPQSLNECQPILDETQLAALETCPADERAKENSSIVHTLPDEPSTHVKQRLNHR